jgi:hypothetical protein
MLFWPKNNAFFAFFQRKIYFPFNSSQTAWFFLTKLPTLIKSLMTKILVCDSFQIYLFYYIKFPCKHDGRWFFSKKRQLFVHISAKCSPIEFKFCTHLHTGTTYSLMKFR